MPESNMGDISSCGLGSDGGTVHLVVQPHPNQPTGESCPIDTCNNVHHGEATESVGPHRRFHERRRGPARTWEIGISEIRSKYCSFAIKKQ